LLCALQVPFGHFYLSRLFDIEHHASLSLLSSYLTLGISPPMTFGLFVICQEKDFNIEYDVKF
jgi:hypothetical protein